MAKKEKQAKRSPLSKQVIAEQMAAQAAHNKKIERTRELARTAFPATENVETIYDGQTVFNAAAAFIKAELAKRSSQFTVSSFEYDLSKTPEGAIRDGVQALFETFADEPAEEIADVLELMGRKLPEFLAQKHLKDPMGDVTLDEFIAK